MRWNPTGEALAARGYDTLTSVQAAVIEDQAHGRDLIVSARTGSGKTVAFGLAMAAYAYLVSHFDVVSGSARILRLFQLVPLHEFAVSIAILFPAVGCGLGMLSSYISIRRHLRV